MNAPEPSTRGQRALAWAVHLFTASGAVLAVLALAAVEAGRWHQALAWLFVALVVDGVDGSMARAARVKQLAGRVDGDTLDLVIDYLNYVFVPAMFLWRAGLVPEPLAVPLAGLIVLSSLYTFARRDMKTPDGYFRGFPALWNVVALYLFVTQPGPAIGAAVVVALAVLTFAPVHFVHPFRVRDYGRLLPVLAIAWAVATVALLTPLPEGTLRSALLAASTASAILLVLLGLLRTVRGERNRPA